VLLREPARAAVRQWRSDAARLSLADARRGNAERRLRRIAPEAHRLE